MKFCLLLRILKGFGKSICSITPDKEDLPSKIDFSFVIQSQYSLKIRMILINDSMNFIVLMGRIVNQSMLRQEATKAEYITLLVNSLSHELITPLTEILQMTEKKRNLNTGISGISRFNMLNVNTSQIADTNRQATSGERNSITMSPQASIQIKNPFISPTNPNLVIISQVANRMYMFLHGLLTFTQILNGKYEIDIDDKVYLFKLLEDIASYFEHRCKQKGISILVDCDESFHLKTSKRVLASVLYSLLDNAVKYTNKAEREIVMSVTVNPSSSSYLFKIVDSGIGVNKRDLDDVFAMLRNPLGQDTTSSSAGLGLGLRTAQTLISELSGNTGYMSITSLLGSGTTVSFELPISKRTYRNAGDAEDYQLAEQDQATATKEYQNERRIMIHDDSMELHCLPSQLQKARTERQSIELGFKQALAKVLVDRANNKVNSIRIAQVSRTQVSKSSTIKPATARKLITHKNFKNLNTILTPDESKRIMIVDDEVFLLEYLRDMLEEHGMEVYSASSPERALEVAGILGQLRKPISMVFMDFNMPGMSGDECTMLLKADQFKPSVGSAVFVALTAQNDAMVKGKFKAVDVTQFIFKPYTFDQIEECLVKNHLILPS